MGWWALRRSWAGDVANSGNGRVSHSVVAGFEALAQSFIGAAGQVDYFENFGQTDC